MKVNKKQNSPKLSTIEIITEPKNLAKMAKHALCISIKAGSQAPGLNTAVSHLSFLINSFSILSIFSNLKTIKERLCQKKVHKFEDHLNLSRAITGVFRSSLATLRMIDGYGKFCATSKILGFTALIQLNTVLSFVGVAQSIATLSLAALNLHAIHKKSAKKNLKVKLWEGSVDQAFAQKKIAGLAKKIQALKTEDPKQAHLQEKMRKWSFIEQSANTMDLKALKEAKLKKHRHNLEVLKNQKKIEWLTIFSQTLSVTISVATITLTLLALISLPVTGIAMAILGIASILTLIGIKLYKNSHHLKFEKDVPLPERSVRT
jgi:hypothetical protein